MCGQLGYGIAVYSQKEKFQSNQLPTYIISRDKTKQFIPILLTAGVVVIAGKHACLCLPAVMHTSSLITIIMQTT